MTPENFCYWLQGYLELDEQAVEPRPMQLSAAQVIVIKDHLALVFNKQTPNRSTTRSQPQPVKMERSFFEKDDLLCSNTTVALNPLKSW